MPSALKSGVLFANRFEIDSQTGSGGMGNVYKALDVWSGLLVALKLLRTNGLQDTERFLREARILAEQNHPGIVGYVAHGVADSGQPFLAMEWLDGEDLAHRLRRQRLGLGDSLTLIHRTAVALVSAHQHGIIHRDLKPSNLFLCNNQVEKVKILDFGIARRAALAHSMTGTGSVIGTPEYMAPEQARGQRDLGPSADIFSLGCVLFECLTGQPPFAAEYVAAVLAKILFEEPPRLRSLQPEIPPQVEALCARMLEKEPARRLPNAQALVDELEALDIKAGDEIPTVLLRARATGLVDDEQRLVSVIMAVPAAPLAEEVTLVPRQVSERTAMFEQITSMLAEHGAQVELVVDGPLIATLAPRVGEATDQVLQGARCALLLKERWPEAAVALTTGRSVVSDRFSVGEAFDRAVRLLRDQHVRPVLPAAPAAPAFILLDELTAGLIGSRLPVTQESPGIYRLQGTEVADASRPLLGKPTPCVGREQELGILEATLSGCIEDSEPHAVLVVGPPGNGKSRLRHEFLRRLQSQHPETLVLLGAGDAMSAGSSGGVLGQALRRLCNVQDGETPEARQAKVRARVAQNVPESAAQRVVEFIGEVCSVPFPDASSIKLRAARRDPRIMGDQIGQALLAFLEAECAAQPVLLILEDLHWGDALTVKLVELLLRELTDKPLMVLALARPEILDLFPNLWPGLVQQIPLRALSKRARERLVQQVLGAQVAPATVARIVDQSSGNALLLEELIRAVADGKGEAPPETVMAMLQARIGNLDPGSRRLLRAASVFGESFWLGGIRSLLSSERLSDDLERRLRLLIEREILEERRDASTPQESKYYFRHTLMREAAYSLLTDEDRRLAHRLAGEYLQATGETDPVILAEHAFRGGDLPRAIPFFIRAAEQALDGNDLAAALHRASQGISCGAQGEQLGTLLAIKAAAHGWRSEMAAGFEAATAALPLLPSGGRGWCKAMLTLFFTSTYLGRVDHLSQFIEIFRQVVPQVEAQSAYAEAASWLVVMASFLGKRELGQYFLGKMRAMSQAIPELDAAVRAWIGYADAVFCHWIENDLWQKIAVSRTAMAAAELAGDRRHLGFLSVALGLAQMGLGDYEAGADTFRSVMALVKRLPDETILTGTAMAYFALGLTDEGSPAMLEQAGVLAQSCLDAVPATSSAAGMACICLARVRSQKGEFVSAEALARRAVQTLGAQPVVCLIAHAALVQVLLKHGDTVAALKAAEEGLQLLGTLDEGVAGEAELRLAAAEAQLAVGDHEAARRSLAAGLYQLRRSAEKIPEPAARARYLTRLPANVRILTLAAENLPS